MATAILEYEPQHYDSLPLVLKAADNAEPSGAITALDTVGKIFVKYRVENDLGIILLHKHFKLSAEERLVQFNNAAIPWNINKNSIDFENAIPAAWRFVLGGLVPYEFIYPNLDSSKPLVQLSRGPFLDELRACLMSHGILDVLGLCLLEENDINAPPMIEIESGRSTITTTVDTNPSQNDDFIHVVWQFGTDGGKMAPARQAELNSDLATEKDGVPVVFKKHKIAHKLMGSGDDRKHGDEHHTTNQ
jgi:hypothetical protein